MIGHRRPTILLVDDEPAVLEVLAAVLGSQGFTVVTETQATVAAALIERQAAKGAPFSAVVTDVMFEGRTEGDAVLAACRSASPRTVVVLMTGYPALEGAVSAIKQGAQDYVQKPVDPQALAQLLHRALSERRIHREDVSYLDLVDILSDMVAHTIERVDPYTAGHGERTRNYCREIAEQLGLDRSTTERLELAAIAHDYGKIYLDDLTFLTKKGPLTPDEYREVPPSRGRRQQAGHQPPPARGLCLHRRTPRALGRDRYPRRLKAARLSCGAHPLPGGGVRPLTTRRSQGPWDLDKTLDFFESQSGRAFGPGAGHLPATAREARPCLAGGPHARPRAGRPQAGLLKRATRPEERLAASAERSAGAVPDRRPTGVGGPGVLAPGREGLPPLGPARPARAPRGPTRTRVPRRSTACQGPQDAYPLCPSVSAQSAAPRD